ncbi:hypothetical protein AOLI_G00180210 [Acnodon oligacanthus]
MKRNPKWWPYWRTLSQRDELCSHVETALLRRVLITNTLKPIQQELSQQGALILTQTQSGDTEDINNFLGELNPGGPNPGLAQGSSSSKVVPMVTDDLGRLTNQPFNTDLNELDKIMEVLAGS